MSHVLCDMSCTSCHTQACFVPPTYSNISFSTSDVLVSSSPVQSLLHSPNTSADCSMLGHRQEGQGKEGQEGEEGQGKSEGKEGGEVKEDGEDGKDGEDKKDREGKARVKRGVKDSGEASSETSSPNIDLLLNPDLKAKREEYVGFVMDKLKNFFKDRNSTLIYPNLFRLLW